MATATTRERKNKANLNHARLQTKQSNQKNGTGPATFINVAEMIIVLGAAITVDVIDILDLTVIGAIIVRFIDIPTLGALWLWRISRHQTGPKKDPTFLILSAFLVELSPTGIIPTWTLFVAYTYFQDTKLAKKTIGKAQKLTTGTKGKTKK
jgi:hypothetical protein